MRFYPAALALSLLAGVTASMGTAKSVDPVDPRAQALLQTGRQFLAQGRLSEATDQFEAALTIEPGYVGTFLALGEAARRDGLQGKAIHYYRIALNRDPNNLAALSGEGGALLEKGAVEKARRNLARLEGLCGKGCPETQELSALIARGPQPTVLSAEAVLTDPTPQPTVETN